MIDIREWYIPQPDADPAGPFTAAEVLQQWKSGAVNETRLCWREGMPHWLSLVDVEPFASSIREGRRGGRGKLIVLVVGLVLCAVLGLGGVVAFLLFGKPDLVGRIKQRFAEAPPKKGRQSVSPSPPGRTPEPRPGREPRPQSTEPRPRATEPRSWLEAQRPGAVQEAPDMPRVDLASVAGIPSLLWRLESLAVNAVAYSPDGRLLGGCCGDGSLRVWETSNGQQVHRQRLDGGKFRCLAFSPDGQSLAAGSDSGVIRLFDARSGRQRVEMKTGTDQVRGLAFSGSGQSLVSIHDRRLPPSDARPEFGIRVWEPRSGQMLGSPHPQIIGLSSSLSRSTGRLYVGRVSGVSVINPDTGDLLQLRTRSSGLGLDANGIAVSPDDQFLAAGQQWGGAVVVNTTTMADRARFTIGEGRYSTDAPNVMTFSPNGALLACGTRGDTAYLWSAGDWQLVRLIHPNGTYVAFSPDGRHLAAAGTKGLEIWDVRAIVLHRPVENDLVNLTGFWQGGSYSPIYLKHKGAQIEGWWQTAFTGTNRATLKGAGPVAADPDGNTVAEWTWHLGTEFGVGRIVADSRAQTATCSRWRGNLRRGEPLEVAKLVPVFHLDPNLSTAPEPPPGTEPVAPQPDIRPEIRPLPQPRRLVVVCDGLPAGASVSIRVEPPDRDGETGGSSSFTLTYTNTVRLVLTAPESVEGLNFAGWSGDGVPRNVGKGPVLEVDLNRDKTIRARYAPPPPCALTIEGAQMPPAWVGKASISVDPPDNNGRSAVSVGGMLDYARGRLVRLSAPPSVGTWTCLGWTGDCKATGTTALVTADRNKSVYLSYSPWPGTWVTDPKGPCDLQQKADQVLGAFGNDRWKLRATADANRLSGTWEDTITGARGNFEWKLKPDGRSFQGWFTDASSGAASRETWTGQHK